MQNDLLKAAHDFLRIHRKHVRCAYPSLWFHYADRRSYLGILYKNPYDVLAATLERIYSNSERCRHERKKHVPGCIYCIDIRSFSAFDHNQNGKLEFLDDHGMRETGTFLKTILLLPYLAHLGVDTVCMLPVFTYGQSHRKGSAGSVYAVKNHYAVSSVYCDPLLEDAFTAHEQFHMLCDACHLLGMNIVLEMVPRTVSRDNDLICEHPDWFYWIHTSNLDTFAPPYIEDISPMEKADHNNVALLYQDRYIAPYIRSFSPSPDVLDSEKWRQLRSRCGGDGNAMLGFIEETFGITTAPAFGDCINDLQPNWHDITYLRFYFDQPRDTRNYLPEKDAIPPFIYYDSIRTNLFKGNERNHILYEYLSGVLPWFQREFGIDGAKIDMAHALDDDLIVRMFSVCREIDPGFLFVSEQFDFNSHDLVRNQGYDLFVGSVFHFFTHLHDCSLQTLVNRMGSISVPAFAASEIHDTPRTASLPGGVSLSEFAAKLICFLPNSVPYILNGFECGEIQPMNLGLDSSEDYRFTLPEDDWQFGALALFDYYAYHWEHKTALYSILRSMISLRRRYERYILEQGSSIAIPLSSASPREVIIFGYKLYLPDEADDNKQILIIIGNDNFRRGASVRIDTAALCEQLSIRSANIVISDITDDKARVKLKEKVRLKRGDLRVLLARFFM